MFLICKSESTKSSCRLLILRLSSIVWSSIAERTMAKHTLAIIQEIAQE